MNPITGISSAEEQRELELNNEGVIHIHPPRNSEVGRKWYGDVIDLAKKSVHLRKGGKYIILKGNEYTTSIGIKWLNTPKFHDAKQYDIVIRIGTNNDDNDWDNGWSDGTWTIYVSLNDFKSFLTDVSGYNI